MSRRIWLVLLLLLAPLAPLALAAIDTVDFMVERYGEFVRYKPALTPATLVLWLAPAVMPLGGFIILVVMLRRRQKALREAAANPLSKDEQQRLQSLLEREADA